VSMSELETFLAEQQNKTIAIAVHDFETGAEIFVNADESFYPASTFKVHVMMEIFHQAEQGLLSLDDCLPITNAFASIVDGAKFSLLESDDAEKNLYPRIGESESILELTRLMIVRSSNLATNILLAKIGAKRVNDFIQALGIEGVTVIRGVMDDAAFRLSRNNIATARGLTHTMKLIAQKKVVSKLASEEMIRIMLGQEFNESIPALLPKSVQVAHKTGWMDNYFHDFGIVYPDQRQPYVISIMTRGFSEDQENAAHQYLASISKIIYENLK